MGDAARETSRFFQEVIGFHEYDEKPVTDKNARNEFFDLLTTAGRIEIIAPAIPLVTHAHLGWGATLACLRKSLSDKLNLILLSLDRLLERHLQVAASDKQIFEIFVRKTLGNHVNGLRIARIDEFLSNDLVKNFLETFRTSSLQSFEKKILRPTIKKKHSVFEPAWADIEIFLAEAIIATLSSKIEATLPSFDAIVCGPDRKSYYQTVLTQRKILETIETLGVTRPYILIMKAMPDIYPPIRYNAELTEIEKILLRNVRRWGKSAELNLRRLDERVLLPFCHNVMKNYKYDQHSRSTMNQRETINLASQALLQCFQYSCENRVITNLHMLTVPHMTKEDFERESMKELETLGFKVKRETNIRGIPFDLVGAKLEKLGLQEKVAVGALFPFRIEDSMLKDFLRKVEQAKKLESRINTAIIFATHFPDEIKKSLVTYDKKAENVRVLMKHVTQKQEDV